MRVLNSDLADFVIAQGQTIIKEFDVTHAFMAEFQTRHTRATGALTVQARLQVSIDGINWRTVQTFANNPGVNATQVRQYDYTQFYFKFARFVFTTTAGSATQRIFIRARSKGAEVRFAYKSFPLSYNTVAINFTEPLETEHLYVLGFIWNYIGDGSAAGSIRLQSSIDGENWADVAGTNRALVAAGDSWSNTVADFPGTMVRFRIQLTAGAIGFGSAQVIGKGF